MPRPRKRTYGRGGVKQQPDGSWRGRVMIDGRHYSVTRDSQHQAKDDLEEIRQRVLGGTFQAETPRLGDWLEKWFADLSGDMAPTTVKGWRWAIGHLRPLHDVRLAALVADVGLIDDLLADLARGRGRKHVGALGRDSVDRVRIVLGQALGYAERRRIISWNPAKVATVPKTTNGKATRPRRSLTFEEAQLVLKAGDGDRFEAGLLLMLVLGMRPGEATGLHWSALDLDAGTLDIVKMRRPQPGGGFVFVDPKAASFRSVRLPAAVVEALRTRQADQAAQRDAAGDRWHDLDLVLSTRYGTALGERQIWKTVARLCTAAGVERISPNELRHTATTLLRNAGVSLEQIRLLVGHADFRMLHQHYLDDLAVVDLTAPMGEVFG